MMNDDEHWFRLHPSRRSRIRPPVIGEFGAAWQMMGMHNITRRRVLVWRIPANNPGRGIIPDGLMRIPMLAHADETIENEDHTLLPMLDVMMKAAAGQAPTPSGVTMIDVPEPAKSFESSEYETDFSEQERKLPH